MALARRGWDVVAPLLRGDDLSAAAEGVDLLLITTQDDVIGEVAAAVRPVGTTVVAHASGSLGLAVLAGHPRRGAVHPLISIPTPEVGSERLVGGWFAVAGDPLVREVVVSLEGRDFEVADEDRALYHAAACIVSNHVVGLLGQVERVGAMVGVPLDAYLDLLRVTIDNVVELGPARALTGPAARGDLETIRRHLAALPLSEHEAYEAMLNAARRLVEEGGAM